MFWGERHKHRHEEDKEIELLRDIDKTEHAILDRLNPRASFIKLAFLKGALFMQGPVVLNPGQSTKATVLYFDQNGAPMPSRFVPPAVTFSIDNPAIASSTPEGDGQTDDIAYVTAGVANLTASVTSAEGLALTDTETVTDTAVVVTPVLSSIKIDFSTPTP